MSNKNNKKKNKDKKKQNTENGTCMSNEKKKINTGIPCKNMSIHDRAINYGNVRTQQNVALNEYELVE